MKKNEKNVYLLIQIVLFIMLIIVAIMSIFINQLSMVTEIIISLLLMITGLNNRKIYKRKYLTVIYFIAGICLLAFTIYSFIVNGI